MRPEASNHRSVCPRCGTESAASEAFGGCPRCLSNALFSNEAPTLSISISSVVPILSDSSQERPIRRLGDYELIEEIARGGMGIVYRARQISLNRMVAVKLMRDSALAGSEEVRRFRVEAAAAAKLKHPHIVAIHEVGEQDGQHYFAMDLVEGTTLGQRTRESSFPPREAADLVATIAEAVQHAHERGVLHRDLKPSNVLLDGDGRPFVTDFGLARSLEADSSLTLTGQVLGTPGYMPPEQATGQGTVGPSVDIYSLGAVLYCLLTGRAPFVGGTPAETMRHVVEQEPVSPQIVNPEVPRDLASVCLKCLAKRSADRYVSAADLAADLRRFVRGEPTHARPTGQTERLWRWCRRKPALATAIGFAVVVGAVGLAGVLWQWQRAQVEANRARRNAYIADMNLAQQALIQSDLGRALDILTRYRPSKGERDSRGWEWRYLWERSCSDERATIGRHADIISALTFTADGSHLASGSHDGTVRVWNTTSWKEVQRLKLASRIRSTAISPDGELLAIGTHDWKGSIFDWKQARVLKEFMLPRGCVLAFVPDGTALLTGAGDGVLEVKRTGDYVRTHRIAEHSNWINAVAFSRDGTILATGGEDNSVRFLDAATWQLKGTITAPVHKSKVDTLAFSPDGRVLLTTGSDPMVRLWDVSNQTLLRELAHSQKVYAAEFSPDGKLVATACGDQAVWLWDAASGRRVGRFQGHQDEVLLLVFSPDGKVLVSGGRDGLLKVWNTTPRTTESLLAFEPGVSRAKAVGGGRVGLAEYAHGIEVWNTSERRRIGLVPTGGAGQVRNFTSDGRSLALGMASGEVQVFSLTPLEKVSTLKGGHRKGIENLAFSPDGSLLVTTDFSGQILVRNWATQEQIAQWTVPAGFCTVTFAPDGSMLAIGRGDGVVELGRIADGQSVALLSRYAEIVPGVDFTRNANAMAFSSDGRLLAVGSKDSVTTIWNVSSRTVLGILAGHRSGVDGVAFSPDNLRLATCGGDGVIKLWDFVNRQEVLTLKAHPATARISFTADGHTLVSASTDGFRYWHAPSLAEIEGIERTRAR